MKLFLSISFSTSFSTAQSARQTLTWQVENCLQNSIVCPCRHDAVMLNPVLQRYVKPYSIPPASWIRSALVTCRRLERCQEPRTSKIPSQSSSHSMTTTSTSQNPSERSLENAEGEIQLGRLLADSHCHPQDDPSSSLRPLQAAAVAVMGVREGDWGEVERLLLEAPDKVR